MTTVRGPSIWAVIAVITLILAAVSILLLVITRGSGTVFVVAIPGFPVESIFVGLLVGVLLIALKRRSSKSRQNSQDP